MVERMEYDYSTSTVRAIVSGIWIGHLLGRGALVVTGKSIVQRTFISGTESWKGIPQREEEPLNDILEFELNDEFAKLRGSGAKTGYWCKIVVSSPNVTFDQR